MNSDEDIEANVQDGHALTLKFTRTRVAGAYYSYLKKMFMSVKVEEQTESGHPAHLLLKLPESITCKSTAKGHGAILMFQDPREYEGWKESIVLFVPANDDNNREMQLVLAQTWKEDKLLKDLGVLLRWSETVHIPRTSKKDS